MKTSATNFQIGDIISDVEDGILKPRAEFQRRLVWTIADKVNFIETILLDLPFPEIYVANGNRDLESGRGVQVIVDGQQRISTIIEYFRGGLVSSVNISPYSDLTEEKKRKFLDYDVAVRHLGTITDSEIRDVFKRINSTRYSLNEIEVNNAVYAGEFIKTAQEISNYEFFEKHKIFRPVDIKRMGDVRFALNVMITLIGGYANRDDELDKYLSEYNDMFKEKEEILIRFRNAMSYIDEIGFSQKSRIWKRSDIFTALIEIDRALRAGKAPDPELALRRIESFYSEVDNEINFGSMFPAEIYYKAAVQASNDRVNRMRRGAIFYAILIGEDPFEIMLDNPNLFK